MIGDGFVVVLLTLYAESKKTEVRFRIAELEKGGDKALLSLTVHGRCSQQDCTEERTSEGGSHTSYMSRPL